LAEQLEKENAISAKIIELDRGAGRICRKDACNRTAVKNGDILDPDILRRPGVASVEAVCRPD
jgi:hypothetical protein